MDRVWAAIKRMAADTLTPSQSNQTGYTATVVACAHFLLGMAGSVLLTALGMGDGLAFTAAVAFYYVAKEIGDLHRGGSVIDGAVDAGFVAFGLFGLSPLAAIILAVLEGLRVEASRNPKP